MIIWVRMKCYRISKMISIPSMGMRIIFYHNEFCLFSISLVIIGGDGSVINVINALIRYLANENRIKYEPEILRPIPSFLFVDWKWKMIYHRFLFRSVSFLMVRIDFPNQILFKECLGTTNLISHSIQGNTDYYTPLIHLILSKGKDSIVIVFVNLKFKIIE